MDLLPDDLLANIFGRLAPFSLAASRCVRKAWCAIIDTRRLLRTDLLPLRLDGFFCLGQILAPPPCFFSRPSTGRRVGGRLDFLDTRDTMDLQIMDHCNGLLLLDFGVVVNPATRQWVRLPPSPHPSIGMEDFFANYCIVYDPIVSPYYEVFLIPLVPSMLDLNSAFKVDSEWPPSPYTTHVFSSKNWRWEERSFIRQGEAVGTIADMMSDRSPLFQRHTIYLRRALYVHCQNDSVMRINLSNEKFRMIESPLADEMMIDDGVLHLGKSEKGVYCALHWNDRWPQFRVWLLKESCDQMEWVLNSNISLQAVVQNYPLSVQDMYNKPWIVSDSDDTKEAWAEEELEWNFDNGAILETNDDDVDQETFFLGFHPYKETAFFWVSQTRVISYHLNSSKVQELGILNVASIKSRFHTKLAGLGSYVHENNYSDFYLEHMSYGTLIQAYKHLFIQFC